MSNSKKYPEAWKIFIECVRKWDEDDFEKYPNGWRYGIPNPANVDEYLFSDCPGKLFIKFKNLFYEKQNKPITAFRTFLDWLEYSEGKMSKKEYRKRRDYFKGIVA